MKKSYPIRQKETYESRSPVGMKTIEVYRALTRKLVFPVEVIEHEVEIPDDIDPEIINHPALVDAVLYEGTANVLMHISPDRSVPHPIRFTIEANSIEEAFEKYDKEAEAAAKELEEEVLKSMQEQQNKIITPGQVDLI